MAFFFTPARGNRTHGNHPFPTPFGSAILGMIGAFQGGSVRHGHGESDAERVIAARARQSEARAKVDGLMR